MAVVSYGHSSSAITITIADVGGDVEGGMLPNDGI